MRWNIILPACLLMGALCQAQRYSFVNYTPKDGLINSRVKSAFQDSRGRMFFLTNGGLSIYDGTQFENFTRTSGLATDVVNDVYEATPDSFLIATNAPKLNTLVAGKAGWFTTSDGFTPVINRFFKSADHQLYIAADEGLFVLKNKKFIALPVIIDSAGGLAHYIALIYEWKNFLLLGTWETKMKEKLILFDKVQMKVKDIYSGSHVYGIRSEPATGNIFLSLGDGLFTIDSTQLSLGKIIVSKSNSAVQHVPSQFSGIGFDKENNEWFYSGNEIAKKLPGGNLQVISNSEGFDAGNITGFLFDREGVLWITTDGNGVVKLVNTNISVWHTLPGEGKNSALSLQCAGDTCWMYDKSKHLIISTSNKGTNLYPTSLKGNFFGVLALGQGLFVYDDKVLYFINDRNKALSYLRPKKVYELSKTEGFGRIASDAYGGIHMNIWSGDSSNLILSFNASGEKFQNQVKSPMDDIVVDRQQHLWVITRNSDLLVFALHPGDRNNYMQLIHNYKYELGILNPRSLTTDINSNIWIGTRDSGVYRIAFNSLKVSVVTHFSKNEGLTDNFIYSLACDKNNNIWAGTQNGLDKIIFDGKHTIIENTSTRNNIFETVLHLSIDSNNTVWALCGQGDILRVESSASKRNVSKPSLFFTSIKINYTDEVNEKVPAIFTYNQNNLSFRVAAPSFIDEHSILYSFELIGGNNNGWSQPSNNAVINFPNLSAGKYKLTVKASFPALIYPNEEITYSFEVFPPWWQTWWFRSLSGALILVFIVSAIRFYYHRKLESQKVILEKQQAIEKERTRIATDMHDDLGAGLSRIKFLSETIGIKKQKQEPIEEDITKIREYSHEMIDKMGEIVWALNERNDSLSDLLSYTRSYTTEYLSQNGIACSINAPENLPVDFVTGEFRRNVFLSVKEILHNIVKHAGATRVNLQISINSKLTIIIADDGIGFDPAHTRMYGNGLLNIKKRMNDIKGIVHIEAGNGTSVKISAPLPV